MLSKAYESSVTMHKLIPAARTSSSHSCWLNQQSSWWVRLLWLLSSEPYGGHRGWQRGIKKKKKGENRRVWLIKAMPRRRGSEYARRSPSVESVYRWPGLFRQESSVLSCSEFTHWYRWCCCALLPFSSLHTSLHYPQACLESTNNPLKYHCYHAVSITVIFFFFPPQETRENF